MTRFAHMLAGLALAAATIALEFSLPILAFAIFLTAAAIVMAFSPRKIRQLIDGLRARRAWTLGPLAVGAIILAGCATNGQGGVSIGGQNSTVADVATFTDTDLVNAENTAVANKDTLAIPCFPALQQWVDSVPGAKGSSMVVSGLASGFEAGRVTINGVGAGVPDYVYTGCGPLYMKVHGQLLALIGGASIPKL